MTARTGSARRAAASDPMRPQPIGTKPISAEAAPAFSGKGSSAAAVTLIQRARDRGVDVWADQYPYPTSGTDGNTDRTKQHRTHQVAAIASRGTIARCPDVRQQQIWER